MDSELDKFVKFLKDEACETDAWWLDDWIEERYEQFKED